MSRAILISAFGLAACAVSAADAAKAAGLDVAGLKWYDNAIVEKAVRMADLAEYMARGTITAIHTRQAVRLEHLVKFGLCDKCQEAGFRARVKEIARAEYDNTRAALELMRRDSRLGWELTMEYRGGTKTVEWKLRRMEKVYELENQ